MSLAKVFFSFREWLLGHTSLKKFGCILKSIGYIALLLWFTHIDLIHLVATKYLSPTETIETIGKATISCCVFIKQELIKCHARFLMLLTNWGMLLLLFLDLCITHRIEKPKVITSINILGVLAVIIAFGFSAGCIVDESTRNDLGVFGQPMVSIVALICFALILCYLKYISIKPKN